jgi:hypothetical protein
MPPLIPPEVVYFGMPPPPITLLRPAYPREPMPPPMPELYLYEPIAGIELPPIALALF